MQQGGFRQQYIGTVATLRIAATHHEHAFGEIITSAIAYWLGLLSHCMGM